MAWGPHVETSFGHLKALWDAIEEFRDLPRSPQEFQNHFIGVLSARTSDADWKAALEITSADMRKLARLWKEQNR